MAAYLRYIGAGSWLPDTPARDLNKEEAEYYGVGRLIDSHLYEFAVETTARKIVIETETAPGTQVEKTGMWRNEKPRKPRGKDGEK